MADVAFVLLTLGFFTAIAVLARRAGGSDLRQSDSRPADLPADLPTDRR